MPDAQRYFIGSDCSCHSYLVPVEKQTAFEVWSELDEDDEAGWDTPDYAIRIDDGTLTFTDPVIK